MIVCMRLGEDDNRRDLFSILFNFIDEMAHQILKCN